MRMRLGGRTGSVKEFVKDDEEIGKPYEYVGWNMLDFRFLDVDVEGVVEGIVAAEVVRVSGPRLKTTDMSSMRRMPDSVTNLYVPSNFTQDRIAAVGVLLHRGRFLSYEIFIYFISIQIERELVPDGTGYILIFDIVTDLDIKAG
ncbi:hypothetical protein AX15_003402 [Amanita polypyramis BW_CC]|nr:hypothetical protein AX15_003402 [Amanita polypyramis BW_CC]